MDLRFCRACTDCVHFVQKALANDPVENRPPDEKVARLLLATTRPDVRVRVRLYARVDGVDAGLGYEGMRASALRHTSTNVPDKQALAQPRVALHDHAPTAPLRISLDAHPFPHFSPPRPYCPSFFSPYHPMPEVGRVVYTTWAQCRACAPDE